MKKLDYIKPVGYVEATFAGSDRNGLYLELSLIDSIDCIFALYDENGQWVRLSYNGNNCINFMELSNDIEPYIEYSICVIRSIDGQLQASYLRNVDLEITSKHTADMFDKRSLYGKPLAAKENMQILPFYKVNKVLAITGISKKEETFVPQIKNEIIYVNSCEEKLESYNFFVKCKRIEGNYVGIVHEKNLANADIIATCIEYTGSEISGDYIFFDFLISSEKELEINKYYMVWTCQEQVYYAPVVQKTDHEYIQIIDIKYIQAKGIEFSVLVDERRHGTYIKTELVNIVEEWEDAKDFVLKEKNNVCKSNKRTVSFDLKTAKKLKELGCWYLCVYTQKDGMEYKIPVSIDDALYIKEFYDRNDTKYKLVFNKKKNIFVVERAYGHNALFKKNMQSEVAESIEQFLSTEEYSLKGNMYGEYVQENNQLKIKLYQNIEDVIEAKLVMFNTQNLGILYTQNIVVTDGTFNEIVVETPDIDWDGKFEKPVNLVWFRVGIVIQTDKGIYFSAIMNYDLNVSTEKDGHLYDNRKLHLNPIGRKTICEIEMEAIPYYTEKNVLSMKFVRPEQLYRSQFTNELLDVKIRKDVMTIKMRCRDCGGTYKGVLMEYRKVKEDDAESYLIPYESLKEDKNGWYIMTTHVDMKKYYMRILYWDIRCAFEKDGKIYTVSCHSNNQRFLRKYKGVFVDRTYPNDNSILFPYATGNASVALMHRETCPQDHWPFRLKEKMAQIIYKLFKKHWDKQNVYLIFEKYCTMAQDNGYFFFKYCMDANVENTFDGKIFYVLEKGASDWEKVVTYKDHVLTYLSLRHMIYLQACKLMISTDTKGHAYVWRSMGSDIKILSYQKKLVFLQHGVTAFKRGHFERGTNVGCEYFITTSQFEHDIIRDYLGYPDEEIPITGFARWDVLHDKSEGHREILMMPTWRTWLDDAENDIFAESDYCKNYMALLNDPRLDEILGKYDVILNFYIHPKFRKFISEFSVVSEHIRLIPFGEEPLNELMMQCNLLITDFSSVAWDVYYMNKPVLFYHFDIEVESKTLGFYMDMENDIFGERAVEPEGLMQLIIKYIENGFVMKEEYSKNREKYFAYIDDNNSERIWNAIKEREW